MNNDTSAEKLSTRSIDSRIVPIRGERLAWIIIEQTLSVHLSFRKIAHSVSTTPARFTEPQSRCTRVIIADMGPCSLPEDPQIEMLYWKCHIIVFGCGSALIQIK